MFFFTKILKRFFIYPKERSWIRAAQRGDFEAFEHIYRVYYKRLYRFFYRLCWDEKYSEELLQETFISLWNTIRLLDPNQGPEFYLYQSATTLFLQKEKTLPQNQSKKELNFSGQASLLDGGKSHKKNTKKTKRKASDALENAIRSALLKLLPERRILFVLCFYQKLKISEIVKILGQSSDELEFKIWRVEKELSHFLQSFIKMQKEEA